MAIGQYVRGSRFGLTDQLETLSEAKIIKHDAVPLISAALNFMCRARGSLWISGNRDEWRCKQFFLVAKGVAMVLLFFWNANFVTHMIQMETKLLAEKQVAAQEKVQTEGQDLLLRWTAKKINIF